MKTVRISLNSIDKVKFFVNDLAKFNVDFDLVRQIRNRCQIDYGYIQPGFVQAYRPEHPFRNRDQ